MGIFGRLLLIVSLVAAALASSNLYMVDTSDIVFGHVLAGDVTYEVAELVGLSEEPTTRVVTIPGGTALGSARLAELEAQGVERVRVYTELGLSNGVTAEVSVTDALAGQTLGMDAAPPRHNVETQLPVPVLTAGTVLDVAAVEKLAAASPAITQVRVADFRLGQWRLWWLFALGAAGMIGGSLLTRASAKQKSAAQQTGATGDGGAPTYAVSAGLLRSVRNRAAAVLVEAKAAADDTSRCAVLMSKLEEIQNSDLFDLQEGLSAFKQTDDGYEHYAAILTPFAFGERQFYRAWSSAVDHTPEESLDALGNAVQAFEAAAEVLTD